MAENADLQDVRCHVHPAVYALEHAVALPARLAPGAYRVDLLLRDAKGKKLRGSVDGKRAKSVALPVKATVLPPA